MPAMSTALHDPLIPSRDTLEAARRIVHRVMPPTPQYRWPLLHERLGTDVWLKHENHTPTGAFKVRGGLVYFEHLAARGRPNGVISATRGNHWRGRQIPTWAPSSMTRLGGSLK